MTFETYAIAAGAIDAAVGLVLGLSLSPVVARQRVAAPLLSLAAAFAGLSALVVGHEVAYGRGFVPGLAWAAMYAPVNAGLAAGAPVVYLLGRLLRRAFGAGERFRL